jgi:hypothetical protein
MFVAKDAQASAASGAAEKIKALEDRARDEDGKKQLETLACPCPGCSRLTKLSMNVGIADKYFAMQVKGSSTPPLANTLRLGLRKLRQAEKKGKSDDIGMADVRKMNRVL